MAYAPGCRTRHARVGALVQLPSVARPARVRIACGSRGSLQSESGALRSRGVAPNSAVSDKVGAVQYLTDRECHDLTALRTNPSPTMAEHQSELAALRKAGYDPSPFWDDPYYPEDLQYAQRLVDYWYQ